MTVISQSACCSAVRMAAPLPLVLLVAQEQPLDLALRLGGARRLQPVEDGAGAVLRAVVDDHDLDALEVRARRKRLEARKRSLHQEFFVVDGNEHGKGCHADADLSRSIARIARCRRSSQVPWMRTNGSCRARSAW